MTKNKNKKRGFTLVEMLVVVLVIGILAAIAMPSYRTSVEKSRAIQGINSLIQIAKAQKTYSFKSGNYAEEMLSLPVDITDVNGANVTGSEFSDQYFDYEIFGDARHAAVARRNNGEYELSVDYGSNEVFCRPIEHKICKIFNFNEGNSYDPEWENCAGQIDEWWSANFHTTGPRESSTASCSVLINNRTHRTDFDFCQNRSGRFELLKPKPNGGVLSQPAECFKGYFTEDGTLVYCGYASGDTSISSCYIVEKMGPWKFLIHNTCTENGCTGTNILYDNSTYGVIYRCYEYDSEGICTRCVTISGGSSTPADNCSFITRQEVSF